MILYNTNQTGEYYQKHHIPGSLKPKTICMVSRKTTALTLQPAVTDEGWRMLFLQQIRCCFIHIIVTALFLHKFYFNVSINLDLWTGPSAFVENWKERKETECGKNVRIHLIMLKLHTPSISPSSPAFTSLTLLIWALSSSLCSFGSRVSPQGLHIFSTP